MEKVLRNLVVIVGLLALAHTGAVQTLAQAGEVHPDSILPRLFSLILEDNFEKAFNTDPRWISEFARIKALPAFKQEREMAALTEKARQDFYLGEYTLLADHAVIKPKIEFMEENGGRAYYRLTFSSPEESLLKPDGRRFVKERMVSMPVVVDAGFPGFRIEDAYDKFWEQVPSRIDVVALVIDGVALADAEGKWTKGAKVGVVCSGAEFNGIATVNGMSQTLTRALFSTSPQEMQANFASSRDFASEGKLVTVQASVRFQDGTTAGASFDAQIPARGSLIANVDCSHGSAYVKKQRELRTRKNDSGNVYLTLNSNPSAITIISAQQMKAENADPAWTGTWTWSTPGRNGGPDRKSTLKLKLEGDKVTATLSAPGRGGQSSDVAISDGKLKGDEISFAVTREVQGIKFTAKYNGKITGDSIKGKIQTDRNGEKQSSNWAPKRETEKK